MAVSKVIERWQGRGASTDEEGVRTLKRQWAVETDSDSTGEPEVIDAVIAHDSSAALYASHPKWLWAVCRHLDAAPNEGPKTWLVDASYSSAPFKAQGDGSGGSSGDGTNSTSPSPLQSNQTEADKRPPTITIARKEITEPLEFNLQYPEDPPADPVRILNTVGDPFDPVPEVFRSHHIITWKLYRSPAKLNWGVRSTWQDTINKDAVTILGRVYPPHSLRCTDYSLSTVWETGPAGLALFFELTCQAEYNPKLWDIKILNTGRRKRIGGSIGDPANPPRLVAIVDDQGQPVADPVPLTLAGIPVVPGGAYHYVDAIGYLAYNWVSSVNHLLAGPGGLLE